MLGKLPPVWMTGSEPGYLLGTDGLGRDVLSRLIYGSRIALTVAFVAGSVACIIGSVLGLLAGYYRGWLDQIVSRIVDIWMAFPPVLFSILLVAVLGTGPAFGDHRHRRDRLDPLLPRRARRDDAAARAWTMSTARASRASRACRRSSREVLPNVLPAIVVLLSLEMGIAVIVEAILSFVNLSISTDDPTWGGMIAEGRTHHPLCLVGAGLPADRALPHRARLRPVRRRA